MIPHSIWAQCHFNGHLPIELSSVGHPSSSIYQGLRKLQSIIINLAGMEKFAIGRHLQRLVMPARSRKPRSYQDMSWRRWRTHYSCASSGITSAPNSYGSVSEIHRVVQAWSDPDGLVSWNRTTNACDPFAFQFTCSEQRQNRITYKTSTRSIEVIDPEYKYDVPNL